MIDVLNPNQIDKEKIKEYINTISSLCESNITAMKNKLNFIFESIVHYDEGYIKKIRPKLYKVINNNIEITGSQGLPQ